MASTVALISEWPVSSTRITQGHLAATFPRNSAPSISGIRITEITRSIDFSTRNHKPSTPPNTNKNKKPNNQNKHHNTKKKKTTTTTHKNNTTTKTNDC